MSIKKLMAQDHRDCDLLFSKAENAASREDWAAAVKAFNEFARAMERHLGVEEDELFPAFEQATGVVRGPTEMMRMEHEQMRGLISEMREALQQQDGSDYLGTADTLLILMQQHNMKEEQMLYNMMDQHLSEDISHWQKKLQDRDTGLG